MMTDNDEKIRVNPFHLHHLWVRNRVSEAFPFSFASVTGVTLAFPFQFASVTGVTLHFRFRLPQLRV
jgi:hypothetical protein